jgi:CSLREA domain-containing protein
VRRTVVLVSALALAAALIPAATGAAFTVTSTADAADANVGDGVCATAGGVCTLRAAIQEANADTATADTITLPGGTYSIAIAGNDDTAGAGDLDLLGPTTVTGAGPASTFLDGGGIDRVFDARGASFTLSGVTVRNGIKSGVSGVGELAISNSVFTQNANNGNGTSGNGGAIEHRSGSPFGQMTLTDVTVTGNSASTAGGGISEQSQGGTWTNVVVSGNTAGDDGGGVFFQQNFATLTILDSIVRDNVATGGDGGGIYAGSTRSNLSLRRSELSGNDARGGGANGGGLDSFAITALENVTVTGNSASGLNGRSGGVAILAQIGHRLEHVTITGNSSPSPPAGLDVPSSTAIKNSIVVANGTGVDCSGVSLAEGHNLQDSDGGCGFDIVSDSPGLAPLADNGGFSRTHGLLAGSPAVDAGTACTTTTDQREVARPVGAACDLGAFEGTVSSSFSLSVAAAGPGTVTSSPAGISCPGTCSAAYASGTTVTLTAAPASGATFGGWGGDCSGTGSCVVTMSAARSVTATFAAAAGTTTTPAPAPTPREPPSADPQERPNLRPSARVSGPAAARAGQAAAFDSAGSADADGSLRSYAWSFGDGTTAVGPTAVHTFERPGTYTVSLTVADDQGAADTATLQLTVRRANVVPVARLAATLPQAKSPLVVRLDGSDSGDADGNVVRYSWRKGPTEIGATAVLRYRFSTPGTYTVTLLVADDDGAVGSASLTIAVGGRLTVVVALTEAVGVGETRSIRPPVAVALTERLGVGETRTARPAAKVTLIEAVGVGARPTVTKRAMRPTRR